MPPDASRRRWLHASLAGMTGLAGTALAACGGSGDAGPAAPPAMAATRSWRMGFSGLPPRFTVAEVIRTIDLWAPRAELAIIHEELPWGDLLAGMTPEAILQRDQVQLVAYYRGKGLQLVFMADPTDGLARDKEAPRLRAAGRSLTEPAVQQLFRSYVLAVSRLLQPEFLGLGAETNLIRAAAPPALYGALRQVANAAAAELRSAGTKATLFSSVQVETAWGRLGSSLPYQGISTDRADFNFAQMLGLSSYPYFAYPTPEDMPADYYSRLQAGSSALPVMVVEGGWASAGATAAGQAFTSSPALQARYLARQATLLDGVAARGVLQLMFADTDLAALPPPVPSNLPLFATLGLVDSQYAAKPALAQWDSLFARGRV